MTEPTEPTTKPTSKVETITPSIAQAILDSDPGNRKIKPGEVEKLVAQMKEGKWQLNGEPIVIDEDNKLMDGQHRLTAVVISGCSIDTFVTRNVPRSSMDTINTGKSRNAADVFQIHGISNPAATSAIARILMEWDRETSHYAAGKRSKNSNGDLVNYYMEYASDIQWAHSLSQNGTVAGCKGTHGAAAILILLRRHNRVNLEEFVGKFKNGGDYSNSPTHYLPIWVVKQEKRIKEKRHRNEQVFAIMHCFEEWLKEKPMTFIRAVSLADKHQYYYEKYNNIEEGFEKETPKLTAVV